MRGGGVALQFRVWRTWKAAVGGLGTQHARGPLCLPRLSLPLLFFLSQPLPLFPYLFIYIFCSFGNCIAFKDPFDLDPTTAEVPVPIHSG